MNCKRIAWLLLVLWPALYGASCGKKKQHKADVSPLKVALTGTHSVSLAWTASTTPGIQYHVYRNGSVVGTTAALTYTDSSLPASTAFTYQLTSFCVTCAAPMSGESLPSASVSVTTLPDNVPPPPPPPPGTYPYSPGFNPAAFSFAYTIGGTVPAAASTHVIDTSICPPPAGVPTCNWPVAISMDSAWLSATPLSGTTAFYMSVKVNPVGLAAGTYHGNITATISQFTTPTKNLPVTLVVTGVTPPPPPPLTLTCAANVCTVGGGVSGQTGSIQIIPGGPTATWKKP